MDVEQLPSGDCGLGQRRVVVASSAAALSGATGVRVSDSGSGTYLAAFWGEKPTGGYSVAVESARLSGGRVTVRLALREPPPDAMVTQALTYPYAVALLRDVHPEGMEFTFTGSGGQELGWPISRASG